LSDPRIIRANGADICIETFGDPSDPTVLLIMGSAASMDWWPGEFCQLLADASRYVVRYDHRDTGQSTTYEPGKPGYSGSDLIRDAVGILDGLEVERAHLVGMSMGGGIAQQIVFEHPERVLSLTLIATSPVSTEEDGDRLPSMAPELQELFAHPAPEPDWSDRAEVVDHTFAGTFPLQGSVRVEETELRTLIERVYDRTKNMASTMTNHWILEDDDITRSLADLEAPTLVLHGTEDPLLPFEHGEALAEGIPDARLVAMPGVGHGELPRAIWHLVVPAIVDITSNLSMQPRETSSKTSLSPTEPC